MQLNTLALFLFLTLVTAELPCFSQTNYEKFSDEESFKLGIVIDRSQYINAYNTTGVGLIIEAGGERVSVNYSGTLGISSENLIYASTGAGQVAGFYLLKNSDGIGIINIIALIGFFIPETINFHAYPGSKHRASIYFSPWTVEQIGTDPPLSETKVSIEGGLKFAVKLGKYYLEPSLGYKHIYNTNRNGPCAALNFYFKK